MRLDERELGYLEYKLSTIELGVEEVELSVIILRDILRCIKDNGDIYFEDLKKTLKGVNKI